MSAAQQHRVTVFTIAVTLACIMGAVGLGALHDLDPQVVAAILSGGMALAGGHALSVSSIGTAVNGKVQIPPELMRQLTDAISQSISGAQSNARHAADMAFTAEQTRTTQPPTAPPIPTT